MHDQETGRISVRRRIVPAVALVVIDGFLLRLAEWVIQRTKNRGVLCDGASVWCWGGDPTPAEWLGEMNFVSTVASTSYGVVASVLVVSIAVTWWRRRRDLALVQFLALLVVAFFADTFEPYTPV
ncbi:hypothetical protein [Microtetraspora sp. NBRC 16547]|uniref:hypothetical protein n=1 Tax=Microtetraspora sp. NBRC 16547 TaxID=3030993 RepID=UPI0024A3B0F0|nr:hypothetical protein [Microtetraspora sp. NBRC 16547]GLX02753.1 hypothetical protein Misp02_68390 [Microtetraspora sp. NBRC 16547]